MPKRAKRSYSADQKAEALRLYPDLGPAETAKLLDIPRATVAKWAQIAGISSEYASHTANATQAAKLRIERKRADLREALLDEASFTLARFREEQEVTIGKGENAVAMTLPLPQARDLQAFSAALNTLIDKFRLESGEHTESKRTETSSPREAIKARLDELSERRANREAV